MTIKMSGFNELKNDLKQLQKNIEEVEGTKEVAAVDLLHDRFMRQYTNFDTIQAFFDQSPWTVETNEDLEAIPADEFDLYVAEHTQFSDWDAMLGKAGEEHVLQKLGI